MKVTFVAVKLDDEQADALYSALLQLAGPLLDQIEREIEEKTNDSNQTPPPPNGDPPSSGATV